MRVARTIAEVRAELAGAGTVGLVPTMGALHAGHAALFRAARASCDTLVASVFLNAPQFSDQGDVTAYPRDHTADAASAAIEGVDILFAPDAHEIYPPGFATWIVPEGAALGLEGDYRPGHFRGVATVVLKLLNIVQPEIAWFGRKDAQQVAVVKQLVRDLNLDVEIRVVDTVRDPDGLALSSRNSRPDSCRARAGCGHLACARNSRRRPRPRGSRRRRDHPRLRRGRRSRRPDPRNRRTRRRNAPDRQHPPRRRSLSHDDPPSQARSRNPCARQAAPAGAGRDEAAR